MSDRFTERLLKLVTVIMTQEQHDRWVHWCGKTGEQLDADLINNVSECRTCHRLVGCLLDHSIISGPT